MDSVTRFQLVDTQSGEILLDVLTGQLISPQRQESGAKRVPGVKVYRGDSLLLRADYGNGWMIVRRFDTEWVQLETYEEHANRLKRIRAANSLYDFFMFESTLMESLNDADAFRFICLLSYLHIQSGTFTGIESGRDVGELLHMSPSLACQFLETLLHHGLVKREGKKLVVASGIVHRYRQKGSILVFRCGLHSLLKVTSSTKHGYLGRLFKNVRRGAHGMVIPPALDTKARRYCEGLRVQGLPLLTSDNGLRAVAPNVAFLGPAQAWSKALDLLASSNTMCLEEPGEGVA